MPLSALLTLALIAVSRGDFSAATKPLANAFTSTPEPVPKVLMMPAAAVLADVLVVLAVVAVALVDVVAVTMLYVNGIYLMKLNKFS